MKYSEIKTGHLYYVDFEPTRVGEFNGVHLSAVLKRNHDNCTVIVVPLTSSPNGEGINKVKIGYVKELPQDTRKKITYAVLDQMRTVNASRVISIKDTGKHIEVSLERTVYLNIVSFTFTDLMYSLHQNERLAVIKKIYDLECLNKAINLSYKIKELRNFGGGNSIVAMLKAELKQILYNVDYTLDSTHVANGIKEIFEESLTS